MSRWVLIPPAPVLGYPANAVLDFEAVFGFFIEKSIGTKNAPVDLAVSEFATDDGGVVQGERTGIRVFALSGKLVGDSEIEFEQRLERLITATAADSYAGTPFVLRRITGQGQYREITCKYVQGLEGIGGSVTQERITMRFQAVDPFFYGDSRSAVLSHQGSGTYRLIAGRINGQWTNYGPPGTGGSASYTTGQAVYKNKAGDLTYLSGLFDNFDGVAAADGFTVWNETQWAGIANMQTSLGHAFKFLETANGDIYAVGNFYNVGPSSNIAYFAKWEKATNTWTQAGGAVPDGYVRDLVQDRFGNIYIIGDFENIGASDYAHVAKLDTATNTFSALGSGLNGTFGLAVAISPVNGYVYFGGDFDTAGGVSCKGAVAYDPNTAAWVDMLGGVAHSSATPTVHDLAVDNRGYVFIVGSFEESDDGVSAPQGIIGWNGTAYFPLPGKSETGTAQRVQIDDRGLVYVAYEVTGGAYTVKTWNGATWSNLDITFPTGGGFAIYDMQLLGDEDIILAFTGSQTFTHAGYTTVVNGSGKAWPTLTIARDNDAAGPLDARLLYIRNIATGRRLLFDYYLQRGEVVTIDLRPGHRSMVSNHFGARWKISRESDISEFYIRPGENLMACYMEIDNSPDVTVTVEWRDTHRSA